MKIAIFEDDEKYRECLQTSICMFPDCTIVHCQANALHMEESFAITLPDVAIVDINMPGINGTETVKKITKLFPTVQCIMLTVIEDLDLVLECMQNGAKAYLLKNKDSITKIIDSIRILHNGNFNEEFPLNGTIANKILLHYSNQTKNIDEKLAVYNLTERQMVILKMLYNGKSYKQIAEELNISKETLNSHIKAIYPKLHINSRSELSSIFGK
jgi:DNA-binding NarL/FixJ family response regulator